MNRKLFLAGGILWIAGLVLSIVGLNLEGGVRSALSVAGNIIFLNISQEIPRHIGKQQVVLDFKNNLLPLIVHSALMSGRFQ